MVTALGSSKTNDSQGLRGSLNEERCSSERDTQVKKVEASSRLVGLGQTRYAKKYYYGKRNTIRTNT